MKTISCSLFPLVWLSFTICMAVPTSWENQSKFCFSRNTHAAQAINDFNARIYRKLDEPGNIFYSPIGLSMALSLAYLGARGETASQMEEALGYEKIGIHHYQVHLSNRQFSKNFLKQTNDDYNFNVANGIFSKIGLETPITYKNDLKEYYEGEMESLNFAGDAEGSQRAINNWANRQTNGKIQNLFTKPLPSNTEFLLANAVYYKGVWKTAFSENNTHSSPFYSGNRKIGKVQMMSLFSERLSYFHDYSYGYKYLELPFKGEDISMIFALPSEENSVVDPMITPNDLCRIAANLRPTDLDRVAIPKFRLEYSKSMVHVLQSLGMKDAFSSQADFSGLQGGVRISDVFQKAVIEVNEAGSEAAAVTGVFILPVSAIESRDFIANRPFAFSIVHKRAGVVLFTGKFEQP